MLKLYVWLLLVVFVMLLKLYSVVNWKLEISGFVYFIELLMCRLLL